MFSIVLIDDNQQILNYLKALLVQKFGINVYSFNNGYQALDFIRGNKKNNQVNLKLILTDQNMSPINGIEVLKQTKKIAPNLPVILFTGYGNVQKAVEALKLGAFDYLEKPVDINKLQAAITKAINYNQIIEENTYLKQSVELYDLSEKLNDTTSFHKMFKLFSDYLFRNVGGEIFFVQIDPPENFSTDFFSSVYTTEEIPKDFDINLDLVRQESRSIYQLSKETGDLDQLISCESCQSALITQITYQKRKMGMMILLGNAPLFSEQAVRLFNLFVSRVKISVINTLLDQRIQNSFKGTLHAFITAIESRDEYTKGHSERVAYYSLLIADHLDLSDEEIKLIFESGLLHDIGKIAIELKYLHKKGKLTNDEFEEMKNHVVYGKEIIEKVHFLRKHLPGILYHHENYDGSGYMEGLKGTDIPAIARIISVADAYDAMTSFRPYRDALKNQIAIDELKRWKGTQFDPRYTDIFLDAISSYLNEDNCIDFERLQNELDQKYQFSPLF